MPPLHLVISLKAADDLDRIWSYVAAASGADRAASVVEKIMDAIDRLAEMPGIGHGRADLPSDTRAWRVHKYLIIYRFNDKALYVDRVIHGHRDLRRLLEGE